MTKRGEKNTKAIVKRLVKNNHIICSGLAKGIDTAALREAIKIGGKVIGVIGTPINHYYPKENKDLQDEIAKNHLLISHVPFYQYAKQSFRSKKFYRHVSPEKHNNGCFGRPNYNSRSIRNIRNKIPSS